MQSVDDVFGIIEKIVAPVPAEWVRFSVGGGAALGQVLAEPVAMAEDSPPFDRAILDGYAVRSADVTVGGKLEVVGQIDAGMLAGGEAGGQMETGQCVGINTGGMMPAGADGVLMVEHSERVTGEGGKVFVVPTRRVPPGYGIQKKGADAVAGEVVLSPGRRLTAADLAVCAAAGKDEISVRRIRAGLLVTGDELVEAGVTPQLGQIRNSNHPMLAGLLRQSAAVSENDGTLLDLGTAGDDKEKLRELLTRGFAECDLMVVSGGMSMGTKDLLPGLFKEMGFGFHVEKVRMKPGKPFVLGKRERDGKMNYVGGLPGNPVSAYVTFILFVRAMIARLVGDAGFSPMMEARAGTELEANGDREFYLPCQLERQGLEMRAIPLKWKGSADLFTLARADGLIVRGVNAAPVGVGEVVRVVGLR